MDHTIEPAPLDLKSVSAEDCLRILANFSREACASMDGGDGLRSGLYLRRIDDALKLRQVIHHGFPAAFQRVGCARPPCYAGKYGRSSSESA